jgi:tetratricopeptide (TPR) repeat protein
MRGRPFLLLALGLAGCARYVVKVDSDPAGAAITLGGDRNKGDRWSVRTDSVAEIAATWPDGQRMATALTVDRDVHVLVRKDGDPAQVVGGRIVGAAAPPPSRPPVATPVPTVPITTGGPAAPGDSMAQARSLADAGQTAYKLTEYDEAIAKFKQAYELVQNSKDPRAAEILSNLQYNLAVVYESSYEVTPDLERLRRARIMYKQFDEQMATLVTNWSGTAEHADVLRRIRALDARIDAKP